MLRLSLVQKTLPQDRWLSSQEPETVSLVEERGIQPVSVRSLGEGVALLKEGKVDAVVHDTPLLRYYLKNNPDSRRALAPQTFEIFTCGITYPGGQPMAGGI
jgi:ABC-type amino acid transport substrate-binding protein